MTDRSEDQLTAVVTFETTDDFFSVVGHGTPLTLPFNSPEYKDWVNRTLLASLHRYGRKT